VNRLDWRNDIIHVKAEKKSNIRRLAKGIDARPYSGALDTVKHDSKPGNDAWAVPSLKAKHSKKRVIFVHSTAHMPHACPCWWTHPTPKMHILPSGHPDQRGLVMQSGYIIKKRRTACAVLL